MEVGGFHVQCGIEGRDGAFSHLSLVTGKYLSDPGSLEAAAD